MEQENGFFTSFERYVRHIFGKSTIPYLWVSAGIVALVIGMSLWQGSDSLSSATSMSQVVRQAAERGDYSLAHRVYTGESNLEGLVYPEREIDQRIAELEGKLTQYPGDRDIYLALAQLYQIRGNAEQAQVYREQARILAPNN